MENCEKVFGYVIGGLVCTTIIIIFMHASFESYARYKFRRATERLQIEVVELGLEVGKLAKDILKKRNA